MQGKNAEPLRLRQKFYNANDPSNITFTEMKAAYRRIVEQHGWAIEEIFFEKRWRFNLRNDPFYYAVLKLKRASDTVTAAT